MKKTLLFSLLSGLLILGACGQLKSSDPEDTSMKSDEGEWTQEEIEAMKNEGEETAMMEDPYFMDFDQVKYDAALASGQTIFLDFHAKWCPTCLANEPEIRAALDELMDDQLAAFRVDYDNSDALQQEFGVFSQSTLILIPNGEVASYKTFGPGLVTQEQVKAFVQE